jgi:hypothetical protein
MIDQIMDMVRQSSQQAVVENPEVPNEQNEAVIQTAGGSLMNSIKGMIQGGNLSSIMELMQSAQSGNTASPAVQNISNNLSGDLAQQHGFSSGTAANIASTIIPALLAKLGSKPGGGFDLSAIMGMLNGGGAAGGGFMAQASAMGTKLGLDKDGDGDTDLNDIKKMFGK